MCKSNETWTINHLQSVGYMISSRMRKYDQSDILILYKYNNRNAMDGHASNVKFQTHQPHCFIIEQLPLS